MKLSNHVIDKISILITLVVALPIVYYLNVILLRGIDAQTFISLAFTATCIYICFGESHILPLNRKLLRIEREDELES